jgi:O-antigen ligase
MIRDDVGSRQVTQDRNWRSVLLSSALVLAGMVALVLGGVVISLLLAGRYGRLGLYAVGVVIGSNIIAVIVLLGQDELLAVVVIAVHLYFDFYLGLYLIEPTVVLALLLFFFLTRSPQHPWVAPRALWLWALFLGLTLFPAIRGATNSYDTAFYYPNLIFGALITFWLGTLMARDGVRVRRFFKILAFLATLLAVHTIIQETTGIVLFGSAQANAFLATVAHYQLTGASDLSRIGSFFVDPNWNGTFFAIMLFIPLGLFVESPTLLAKVLYLAETFIILPALLFTFSAGSWIAAIASMIVFIVFVGRARWRVLIPLYIIVAAIVLVVWLPRELSLLLQHATKPQELSLRVGGWETGWRVILAFPLTGVGLGLNIYEASAEPYRVPAQTEPLVQPHNSYLEWGAMAGLPVLIVFVALVSFALWLAWRNWKLADVRTRSLLGGGIAAIAALSINSWSIDAWTLPPLAALGWLILGVISSPLLVKSLNSEIKQEKSNTVTSHSS